MSVLIDPENFTHEERKKIVEDLTIQPLETEYGQGDSWYLFNTFGNKDSIQLPFYYYNSKLRREKESFGNTNKKFSRIDLQFEGELRDVQHEIKPEVFKYLNQYHSLLISLYTGGGKTAFSIYLATKLGYKTLICVHRINIIEQWVSSINKFIPKATVQLLDSSVELDPNAHFYVINTDTINKRSDLNDMGLLIVDEADCACTEKRALGILSISPRYCIALTATADKSNGMDKILDLTFGPRVVRKMFRPFNVYLVESGYKPTTVTNKAGKMDWTGMITNMCSDEERNNLLVKIANYFSTRNFIILCKRKDQVDILYEKLVILEGKEAIEKYTGTKKTFNNNCRILVSTYSKSGIGFDFPKLDALIIASDVDEGIEQYLGRVFRKEDTIPIIFDMRENVYKNHPFAKHLKNRCDLYERSGGVCKSFESNFILP